MTRSLLETVGPYAEAFYKLDHEFACGTGSATVEQVRAAYDRYMEVERREVQNHVGGTWDQTTAEYIMQLADDCRAAWEAWAVSIVGSDRL